MLIRVVSEGRLSVLIHLSALLTDVMFATSVASVKLQYFSNYLLSTVENYFISRDDVTGDKIIIRAISYITNARYYYYYYYGGAGPEVTSVRWCQARNAGCEVQFVVNPLNPKLNPICYLLALLGAHHFLHVNRIRVKLLSFRLLMSCIYIYIWSTHSWCF